MSLTTVRSLQSMSSQSRLGTNALHRTGRLSAGLALGLSVCLLVSSKAEANTFEFQKVVDTNTPIPGGIGNFAGFGFPALDNRNVAFQGEGPYDEQQGIYTQAGIYIKVGDELRVVADRNTPTPGGSANFDNFYVTLDKRNLAFLEQQGIYANIDGKLKVIADHYTPIPGGTENFNGLSAPSLDSGNVAFAGSGSFDEQQGIYNQAGIYIKAGDELRVVADRNTLIPGGTGNFIFFGNPSLDNGNVAFEGYGGSSFPPSQQGIYIKVGNKLKLVADRDTSIPGGAGNFATLGYPSLDKGDIAFVGSDSSFRGGIYANFGDKLKVIADRNTPIPGGTGNFIGFSAPSLDSGNVAFAGGDPTQPGLYTTLGGSLRKVIAPNNSLDGKTVSSVAINREALSGNRIAFFVAFTDGSKGIYTATLK